MSYTIDCTITADSSPVSGETITVKSYQGSSTLAQGTTDAYGVYSCSTISDATFDVYGDDFKIEGAGDGESFVLDVSSDGPDELPATPDTYDDFPTNTWGEDDDLGMLDAEISSFVSDFANFKAAFDTFLAAFNDESFPDIDNMPEEVTLTAPAWVWSDLSNYASPSNAAPYRSAILTWLNSGAYDAWASAVNTWLSAVNSYFYDEV